MAPLQFRNITYGTSSSKGSIVFRDDGSVQWQSNISSDARMALKPAQVKSADWYSIGRVWQLKLHNQTKGRPSTRFTGFVREHEVDIKKWCEKSLQKPFKSTNSNLSGGNWCQLSLKNSELVARTEDKQAIMFSIDYKNFAQSIIQGKNELAFEFKAPSKVKPTTETLVEMRVHIPNDEAENDGEGAEAAYEEFNRVLMKKAALGRAAGEIIASFKDVVLKVPRGKYDIDFFADVFRLHGKTYNYKIKYSQIKRLFLFTLPTQHIAFLVALQPPIRQGQTTYSYLIMDFPDQEIVEAKINATEEDMKTKFLSKSGAQLLKGEMEGKTYDIVSRVFLALAKCKIITTKDFESHYKDKTVKCSMGPETGLLYPLERSFFFIFKPPTYIKHSEIDTVEFGRADGAGSGRMFDIHLHIRGGKQKVSFTNIAMYEFEHIFKYCTSERCSLKVRDAAKWKAKFAAAANRKNTRGGGQRRAAMAAVDSYKNQLIDEAQVDDSEDEDDDFKPGDLEDKMLKEDADMPSYSDDDSQDSGSDIDMTKEQGDAPDEKPIKAEKPQPQRRRGKKRSSSDAELDDEALEELNNMAKKARTAGEDSGSMGATVSKPSKEAPESSDDDAPIGS